MGEWKESTFEGVLAHANGRVYASTQDGRYRSDWVDGTPIMSLLLKLTTPTDGVQVVRFTDGTAVASEGAYSYDCGSETTPEIEAIPAKWWIYEPD